MEYNEFEARCKISPRVTRLFGTFSSLASGKSGKPALALPLPDENYLTSNPEVAEFYKTHRNLWGRFDPHFFASIPGALEEECRLGSAILSFCNKSTSITNIYTLGTAEGTMARTLGQLGEGRIRTLSCSPNIENRESFFLHGVPRYSEFFLGGFFEISGNWLDKHPHFYRRFDIVIEDTTFQMYGPNREEQIHYVKRFLANNGILIVTEKMLDDDIEKYVANEKRKDQFKQRYFTIDQIREKDEILQIMERGQVTLNVAVESLRSEFKYVTLFWNSGNFYSLASSNSRFQLRNFLEALPPPYIE